MIHFLKKYLMVFLVSMVPVIELRGAVPMGISWDLNPFLTYIISVAGNMIPVPFILLCIRSVFSWMSKRGGKLEKIVLFMQNKANKNAKMLYKYKLVGLYLLVAVPLPGTGAWTGALVAAMFNLNIKVATIVILLGVLTAGIAVLAISYGLGAIFV